MWCWELLDPPSWLPFWLSHVTCARRTRRLLCTPSSDTTRKTKHMAPMFLFPNTVYGVCAVGPCLLHISQYDDSDSKLCSMGHRLPPHMVLPPETTEFAACLCRTHSATPISAQCVIACINTWPSHKQTLKWLHVAAISRSYLSLHVFLFLPPAPRLRVSECGHLIFANCQ